MKAWAELLRKCLKEPPWLVRLSYGLFVAAWLLTPFHIIFVRGLWGAGIIQWTTVSAVTLLDSIWITLNFGLLILLVNRERISRVLALMLLVILVMFIARFHVHPDRIWSFIYLYFAASVGLMFTSKFGAWLKKKRSYQIDE